MPKNTKERAALVKAEQDAEKALEEARAAVLAAEEVVKEANTARWQAHNKVKEHDLAAKRDGPLNRTMLLHLEEASKPGGFEVYWVNRRAWQASFDLYEMGLVSQTGNRPMVIKATDAGRAKLDEAKPKKARAKPTKGR